MSEQWYYNHQGHEVGPLASNELRRLASLGILKPEELVRKEGMTSGRPASQIRGLFSQVAKTASGGKQTPISRRPISKENKSPPILPNNKPPAIQEHRPVPVPCVGASLPTVSFLTYCGQHFAATHWPTAIGIALGVLALPFLSLSKPSIGFRGLCFILGAVIAVSLTSGSLYILSRLNAYYVGGQRSVPERARSALAPLAYAALMFLIPTIPLVIGEYFTPPDGLLVTMYPEFRKEQARWFVAHKGSKDGSAQTNSEGMPSQTEEVPAPEQEESVRGKVDHAAVAPVVGANSPSVAEKVPLSGSGSKAALNKSEPKTPLAADESEKSERAVEQRASTNDKSALSVIGQGAGTTEDEALKDAFRDAVWQAVGAVVDAETVVKNDDVISEEVLTHSDGLISRYGVISTKTNSGLHRTKIQAVVERRKLIQKLQAANITVKKGNVIESKPE
jgi:hypothetical protein